MSGTRMTVGQLTEIMEKAWEALQEMQIVYQENDDHLNGVRMEVFYEWHSRLERLYEFARDTEIS